MARLEKIFTPPGPSSRPERPAEVMRRPDQEYRIVETTTTISTVMRPGVDSMMMAPLFVIGIHVCGRFTTPTLSMTQAQVGPHVQDIAKVNAALSHLTPRMRMTSCVSGT